jgi:uncharacterized protein
MRKIFIFIFISGLSFTAFSQKNIYKITGNGISKPSYLFGTFHILCKEDFSMSRSFLDKISETEQLALELDMDDPQLMMKTYKGMAMQGDSTMKMLLSPEKYQFVAKTMKDSMQINLRAVEKVKPYMVYAMVMPKLLACDVLSIENELVKVFSNQNKETVGLEEVSDQLAVFDLIPYKDQANELAEGLEYLPLARKELRESVELYKLGNYEEILKLSSKKEGVMVKYESELLTNRNKNWIPKIIKMATEKPTFFAVGAGHLVGNEGLISLLKQKGYEVELIKQFAD